MEKKVINTRNAPAPIGPYSQAIVKGPFLFVSGQVPINPETGNVIEGDIQAQTKQVMENIQHILTEAGYHFADVIKTSIFFFFLNQFSLINEVYGQYFEKDFPARETVEVSALPKFVDVEISVIACK